jgi:hypothetical protein
LFLGLLRSPRGLTLFVPAWHAAHPLMNLRFFSLTKSASWRTKLDRQLADFEQWKLMSSGMAIFFYADFSMGNYRP